MLYHRQHRRHHAHSEYNSPEISLIQLLSVTPIYCGKHIVAIACVITEILSKIPTLVGVVCKDASPRSLRNFVTFSTCDSYCCFCLSPMSTSRPLYTRYIILDICQLGLTLTAPYISAWSMNVVSCC
jgi:hypothetical protein